MGGGSSSSSTPAWQSKEIRFAPYIEARHSSLLEAAYVARLGALNNSPYSDYVDIDYDSAIIGIGYTITSFPALYDMFKQFGKPEIRDRLVLDTQTIANQRCGAFVGWKNNPWPLS